MGDFTRKCSIWRAGYKVGEASASATNAPTAQNAAIMKAQSEADDYIEAGDRLDIRCGPPDADFHKD